MRPLLVSIALLLLAQCNEWHSMTFDEKMRLSEYIEKWHFLVSIPVAFYDMKSSKSEANRRVNNGVLCAFQKHQDLAEVIKQITKDDSMNQKAEAKKIGITCDDVPSNDSRKELPEWKCFCTEQKHIIYCALLRLKNTLDESNFNTTCSHAGYAKANSFFNYLEKNAPEMNLHTMLFTTDEGRARFFCDAVDPVMYEAMETYYDSDPYPSLMETVMILIEENLRGLYVDLHNRCTDSEFATTTDFGKCECEDKRGYAFCPFHVLGKEFIKEGYLKCEGAPIFDELKKPDREAYEILDATKGGSRGGFKKERSDNEGGSNENFNKDKTGSANGFSLLVAPLAASAAILL